MTNNPSKPPLVKNQVSQLRKQKAKAKKEEDETQRRSTKAETASDWSYPSWTNAPRVGCGERLELTVFKLITFVPVCITFGIFAFLFTFYITCFIYPTLLGDFEGTLGLSEYWASP